MEIRNYRTKYLTVENSKIFAGNSALQLENNFFYWYENSVILTALLAFFIIVLSKQQPLICIDENERLNGGGGRNGETSLSILLLYLISQAWKLGIKQVCIA